MKPVQAIKTLIIKSQLLILSLLLCSYNIRTEPTSIEQGLKMKDSSEKVDILTSLALLEVEKNPSAQKEPFRLVNQAIRTAKKIANNQSLAVAYNTKAIIFREFSTFSQAIEYHKKAIKIAEQKSQKPQTVDLLLDLGATYRASLDFDNAKSSFEEAQQIALKNELHTQEAVAYLNIGFLYTSLEIQDASLSYFEKAVEISEKNKITDAYILAIIGKGLNYSLGNSPSLSKAKKCFVQSVTSSKKKDKKYFEGLSRTYLGRTYLRMNKISNAYQQFENAQIILTKYKFKETLDKEYKSLGDVLKFRNFLAQVTSYQNSLKYYRGEISQNQYNSAVKEELELFGNPDQEELEQLRTALTELKNHYTFLDSIDQLDEEEAVFLLKNYLDQQSEKVDNLEIETSHFKNLLKETEKAAKQKIQILEQKNLLQQALISKQYWTAASLILLVIFVGVISVLQFRAAQQKKKINIELEIRNEKISDQNIEITSTAHQLEKALNSLQTQSKKTEESIQAGWKIQNAMLPSPYEFKNLFREYFVMYQPRDIVSGDFYWVGKCNDKIIVAALDCTGHGIPGAFMSMMGNTLMNQVVNIEGYDSPSEILAMLDSYIAQTLSQEKNVGSREGMDVAICSISPDKQTLQFAGAKNPLLVVHEDNTHDYYKGTNRHVGGNKERNKNKTYEEHTIRIIPSDTFYIYSDGIQDQFGGDENKKFMRKQLISDLVNWNNYALEDQKEMMSQKFNSWKNSNRQIDDIMLIGFKC